jgi:actin-related protein
VSSQTAIILIGTGLILQFVCLIIYMRTSSLQVQRLQKIALESQAISSSTYDQQKALHTNILRDAKEIMEGKEVDIPTDLRMCPECGNDHDKSEFRNDDYMCVQCRTFRHLFS